MSSMDHLLARQKMNKVLLEAKNKRSKKRLTPRTSWMHSLMPNHIQKNGRIDSVCWWPHREVSRVDLDIWWTISLCSFHIVKKRERSRGKRSRNKLMICASRDLAIISCILSRGATKWMTCTFGYQNHPVVQPSSFQFRIFTPWTSWNSVVIALNTAGLSCHLMVLSTTNLNHISSLPKSFWATSSTHQRTTPRASHSSTTWSPSASAMAVFGSETTKF